MLVAFYSEASIVGKEMLEITTLEQVSKHKYVFSCIFLAISLFPQASRQLFLLLELLLWFKLCVAYCPSKELQLCISSLLYQRVLPCPLPAALLIAGILATNPDRYHQCRLIRRTLYFNLLYI